MRPSDLPPDHRRADAAARPRREDASEEFEPVLVLHLDAYESAHPTPARQPVELPEELIGMYFHG